MRVCSAPTGAGKSYAFQRAVVERDQRVLFIVPTRRLAQNLARSVLEDLVASPACDARSRVVLWTSDERERLRVEEPDLHVGRLRAGQLRGWEIPAGGSMVIATPESIAWMLLRPSFRARGAPPVDLADLLRLDHIVFDEFHSIDVRGYGLAAALACAAAQQPDAARITFLSATAIDIGPALAAFGTARESIHEATEPVVSTSARDGRTLRAVHGDVAYRFVENESMLNVLTAHESAVRACLARDRQVTIVFDSLAALNAEKESLAMWCEGIGVSLPERLSLNSSDDSTLSADDGLFSLGRDRDPMSYRVLLATSTIELGVTFRAGLMAMDPGHDPASFVQRAGRVARGDEPGEVLVRLTARSLDRSPWLRALVAGLPHDGSIIEIGAFLDAVLRSLRSALEPSAAHLGDIPPRSFGTLTQRAVWCAAVFWAALECAQHFRLGQRRSLEDLRPAKASCVLALLRQIRGCGLVSASYWCDAFLDEALRFRVMLPRVRVSDASPSPPRSVPWNIYASHVELSRAPAHFGPDGVLEVNLDLRLDAVIRDSETTRWTHTVEAQFPHESRVVALDGARARELWLREAQHALSHPLRSAQRRALEGALTLVRLSGIVPALRDEPCAVIGGSLVV